MRAPVLLLAFALLACARAPQDGPTTLSYASPYGPIAVAWRREGRDFSLDVSVPANTTATVHVPGESEAKIVGGGSHRFTSVLP